MTNDTKALADIFEGNGPVSSLFMLGYAGWYPGQLEKEIMEDSWLVVNADPELVFNKSHSQKNIIFLLNYLVLKTLIFLVIVEKLDSFCLTTCPFKPIINCNSNPFIWYMINSYRFTIIY